MSLNRVMHVDDDESIRIVASIALSDIAGFDLQSCASGQEALDNVEQFAPQLILLDVMMPKMDGLETLQGLRQLPSAKDIPVVFMTAKTQLAEKNKYLDAGAIGVVEKPFEPMALGDILRQLYTENRRA